LRGKNILPGLNGSMRTSAFEHNLWTIAIPSGDFKFKAIDRFPLPWRSSGGALAYSELSVNF
jgi:hypothetical protein